MKKIKLSYLLSTVLFVAVELVMGVLLQTGSGRDVAYYSFTAILLCCLFALFWARRDKGYLLTQTALICTVVADFFLVLCEPRIKLPAMIFFLTAQLCYMARICLTDENRLRLRVEIVVRALCSLGITAATLIVLGKRCDLLAVVSMLYYVQLFLNIIFAFIRFKKNLLLSVGLLLFIFCDTLIGISMLEGYFPVDSALISRIVSPGFDLAWAFYLPSQVLVAISTVPFLQITKERKIGEISEDV